MYLLADFGLIDKILPSMIYGNNYIEIKNYEKSPKKIILLKNGDFYESMDFKTFKNYSGLNIVNDNRDIDAFLNEGRFKRNKNESDNFWYELGNDFYVERINDELKYSFFYYYQKKKISLEDIVYSCFMSSSKVGNDCGKDVIDFFESNRRDIIDILLKNGVEIL